MPPQDTAALTRELRRKIANAEFVMRLIARRPEARKRVDERVRAVEPDAPAFAGDVVTEATGRPSSPFDLVAETIVNEERPVLFVRKDGFDAENVTIKGLEAKELVGKLQASEATIKPLMALVGRIDVEEFPGSDYVGTGWLVDSDIVVTNRHVASLIALWDGRRYVFSRGIGGQPMKCSLSTLHEFDDLDQDASRVFEIAEVLYIEPDRSDVDIAFLRITRKTDGRQPSSISIAPDNASDNHPVVVVGYPARAPKRVIPDQALMTELYRDRFDVKRAAPGYTIGTDSGVGRHDCTTLGGNSGSVVLDLNTGRAVGLHFAGLYQESNYAVSASVLAAFVNRKAWQTPRPIETGTTPQQQTTPSHDVAMAAGVATVTIPVTITVSLGATQSTGGAVTQQSNVAQTAETAVKRFWSKRPDGVVAVRVGFEERDGRIGDTPYISASVPASRLALLAASGPNNFDGFSIRYEAANVAEQLDAHPAFESVDSIAYDDDARKTADYSFDEINEEMTVRAHVGPEYSWEELETFLSGAKKELVSAIYEFHATHIADAIEDRLKNGVSLTLLMDNLTFSTAHDGDTEFDRANVFSAWKKKFKDRFERIVVPEGRNGLISDAYHIKVSVRKDDTFWLSSGNWKAGSSQPIITQEQRDGATEKDLPGNREWHVIVRDKTLAGVFRSHILQDFQRSNELGGGPTPRQREAPDIFVDVPIELESPFLERPAPSRILEPETFEGKIKVKPLLTPDKEGAVYSDAVLELIRSARKSLLFQIPYISMPSNPNADRGYIDELIDALTDKLKTLDTARVILRTGGSALSAPTHAAWYFKSKGVDIDERVRQIDNHHTKGMIVDGRRVLIGSHNWSKPGVSLNRDASLIFDHKRIAGYFTDAFDIDWDRSRPISPRRHAKELVIREAVGSAPPRGFRRVRLSDLLKEED